VRFPRVHWLVLLFDHCIPRFYHVACSLLDKIYCFLIVPVSSTMSLRAMPVSIRLSGSVKALTELVSFFPRPFSPPPRPLTFLPSLPSLPSLNVPRRVNDVILFRLMGHACLPCRRFHDFYPCTHSYISRPASFSGSCLSLCTFSLSLFLLSQFGC